MQTIPTSVVPWIGIEIDASGSQNAEDVYDKLRLRLGEVVAEAKERVTAVRLLITGHTDAHAELNRDPEAARNEAISIANEWSGLLWIERVRVATLPRIDRDALIMRDDPIGEVARVLDSMRSDVASLSQLPAVEELRKKLPNEIAEGSDPIALDAATLSTALEEAEGLLLARLSALEAV